MSNYIKMVDCSEEELMHYGVLGMKWHHHKAKQNYNKMMQYKSSAQNKMNSTVQTIPKNGKFGKETKKLLKSGYKDLETANKYLRKHNKYVDKMNAGFDEERDKVMQNKKYKLHEAMVKDANDRLESVKNGYDPKAFDNREQYDAFVEGAEYSRDKHTKAMNKMTNKVEKKRKKYTSFVY